MASRASLHALHSTYCRWNAAEMQVFNDLFFKNRAVLIKHKWISDSWMSFVRMCVCVCTGSFPWAVLFCSSPRWRQLPWQQHQPSKSLPLPSLCLPLLPYFSLPLSSFFSLQSFIPPSLFVSALPHSLPPPSSITVSRPPAYIYMAQLVLGQALSSLAATYGKLVHIPPQCCPPIPPFTLNAGRFHDPPSSFHFCCWSQFAPHFYCVLLCKRHIVTRFMCNMCNHTYILKIYIV